MIPLYRAKRVICGFAHDSENGVFYNASS